MKLKQILKDKTFYKTVHDELKPLSRLETALVTDFIDTLLDEDNCQLIFRGERISHAYNKSGVESRFQTESEDLKFCKHGNSVFFIGSKADSYLFKFDDVNFPIDLNNTDESLFKAIYKEFERNIKHECFANESVFINYFKDNLDDFLKKILNLEIEERVKIKYYYLWLLHVIGETNYKKYSNFLSTTKDYDTACGFGNEELVYVGWIPRPIKRRSLYLGSLMQLSKRLRKLNLPTYTDEPHPDENEISLIGGLFPHYILGIYYHNRNLILINNNLLKKGMKGMIKFGLSNMIIKHGIGIDQSNFENSEFLKISNYKRYLSYIKEEGYIDHE